jgi:hypothetical protein
MAQLTIYLDNETEQLVKRHVKGTRTSASKWVAEAVRNRVLSEWPADVVSLFGSWKKDDFPDAAELRREYGTDARREEL